MEWQPTRTFVRESKLVQYMQYTSRKEAARHFHRCKLQDRHHHQQWAISPAISVICYKILQDTHTIEKRNPACTGDSIHKSLQSHGKLPQYYGYDHSLIYASLIWDDIKWRVIWIIVVSSEMKCAHVHHIAYNFRGETVPIIFHRIFKKCLRQTLKRIEFLYRKFWVTTRMPPFPLSDFMLHFGHGQCATHYNDLFIHAHGFAERRGGGLINTSLPNNNQIFGQCPCIFPIIDYAQCPCPCISLFSSAFEHGLFFITIYYLKSRWTEKAAVRGQRIM